MRFEMPGRFGVACTLLAMVLAGFAGMCLAEVADVEDMSAHVQMTYNWQKHPAYQAAYSGPNSIMTAAEKMYTFSTTAFFGLRPWQGGEFYFNPEAAQGVPFSTNLVGMGGFTNGEITRAAGTNPILYRQRLFFASNLESGRGIAACRIRH